MNRANRGGYAIDCVHRFHHCCRFNYLHATTMTGRDSEVVSSPLVDQQQEDGQRHHSAGTLEPPPTFGFTRLPRDSYAF